MKYRAISLDEPNTSLNSSIFMIFSVMSSRLIDGQSSEAKRSCKALERVVEFGNWVPKFVGSNTDISEGFHEVPFRA
jgi:hypothetical protein